MKIILLLLFATILFSKPIDLSLEEKEFLQSHPKIILGVGEGWEPIAIRNNRGEITGFDVDILNEINKKTGANFTLKIDKWEKAQERAKNKELDGLSSLIQTPKRDEDFNFSNIFNSMDIIILTRKDIKDNIKSIDDLDGKTIAKAL